MTIPRGEHRGQSNRLLGTILFPTTLLSMLVLAKRHDSPVLFCPISMTLPQEHVRLYFFFLPEKAHWFFLALILFYLWLFEHGLFMQYWTQSFSWIMQG